MREGTACLNHREVASTGVGILDGTRREDDTIANLTVACHLRTIAEHTMVTDLGVVADMGTFEQEVVITNLRDTILLSTTVDNHVLTDDIIVANLHIGLGPAEVEVLREGGNHTTLVDLITFADTRPVADADEGEDDTVVTYLHIVLDIHEGEYLTVIAYFRLWRDFGLGGYFTCHNCQLSLFNLICTSA